MATLLPLLLSVFLPVLEEKSEAYRYLRPQGDKFVLESEVTIKTTSDGSTFASYTERPSEKMTLTITRDKNGKATRAQIVYSAGENRKLAKIEWKDERATLTRDGVKEEIKVPATAVITTAPDWSDILQLIARYDARKGGKQGFPGVWFHPTKATLTPTFTVEKVGADTVKVKDKDEKLDRYKVTLRSGGYLVWAKENGVVCKILSGGEKAMPVVLQGYEEATAKLK